jgi:FKBP-type peptidyl-prolyl cis-trans isomerase (trigger factor)
VPRYQNRRKSLSDVNSKLKTTIESANLAEHITELRQSALDTELSRLEEQRKAALEQSAKKGKKKDSKTKKNDEKVSDETEKDPKPLSLLEEELKSKKKSLLTDETDTPDSDSGKKLW